ncbi:hypothetical protein I316_02498 [Kwoniella heveanensis BCC8398]|uniref:DH domain-containing protein n=1 Tax=Kwoniella heveanensis BCC8398 TaxID=1296120 RepID=A0A1B9GYB8_9TREE|nr:hypothetical protein I316_02498 [Kwoniella heveanensis BCC8398]
MPVSTPPRHSSPSKRAIELPSYRRSPSVSEAIQKYESKSREGTPSPVQVEKPPRPSGIPRPRGLEGKGSISGTAKEGRRVTDRQTKIPQPKPFPRSISDTFSASSNATAGPSRLPTPSKPAVAISVSRPTPPLRRKSSKDNLTKASQSGSSPSKGISPDQEGMTLYFGEFGERENKPTVTQLEAGSTPMVRGGPNRSSRSSIVEVHGSTSSHGSPKMRVAIPKRTSSQQNSPTTRQPISPTSPRSTVPPPISPRTSSKRLDPSPPLPRASTGVGILGEPIAESNDSRRNSQSSMSTATVTNTSELDGRRPSSAASSSRMSTPRLGSPKANTSPRKSPNLTIQTRPTPTSSRLSSTSIAQPSPPIPAKSPLRNLSRENSEGRSQTPRSGSVESNVANVGTPTSSGTRIDALTPNEQAVFTEPPTQIIATPDDVRFTQYTIPSVYSQESAPSSATGWAINGDPDHRRRPSRLDTVDWGKQGEKDSGERHRRSSSLPRLDKMLPRVPETPSTATTFGSDQEATIGHAPLPSNEHREPLKSPSLPMIRGEDLLPAATLRSSTDPMRPLLPSSPSIVLSKRTHLINEIATSERNYAKDLALVRDAYMYRFIRPMSTHSSGENTDASRRSSTYTYQTAETKRSSGHESWVLPKSPSEGFSFGHFPNGSSSSSFGTPQPSIKQKTMAPPVGKPLSPADLKAVFLNLDQLANAADDLATAFEQAMGEQQIGREGDDGTDRLGHAFVKMIPRIRPLYNFYCARQAVASLRLVELQSDPSYHRHLDDCWRSIKQHTHAWNLDSMLIKPVQRITKYPLLFDDLLACTTPVHPDYFAIRTAAQMSRAIATEIDEAKRRKDVVSSVIKITSPKEPAPKLLGLKRFRKDKMTRSASSVELVPAAISEASLSQIKDHVLKVDELDHCVRRVGREVLMWTAAAKEVLLTEDGMVKTWLRMVQLEPTDSTDRKILEFRKVVDAMISGPWQKLNEEVRSIIPIFGKILESTSNPKKVIAKRDSKYMDYSRFHALRASKKAVDKNLVASAAEFVALHTQLVDELPGFLEGCLRILDIALVAFARAQARYHRGIKEKVAAYAVDWLTTQTNESIVKAWHEHWAPYADAMDHFQVTRPGDPSSRPSSPAHGRYRSSSLRSQTTPTIVTTSPRDSKFSLLRRNSKTNARPPLSPRHSSGLRPSSVHSETSSRLSWGLPRISADQNRPIFDGLGLSPTKSMTLYNAVDLNSSQVSLASTESRVPSQSRTPSSGSKVGLGLGNVETERQLYGNAAEADAAEGWRNEKVLYQCACVADFDPSALGNRPYRGLRFLPLISGDLVDIFHEVGRIDELPSFPYPEVGVDNDGVLVGRSEEGSIGLVICSFLEPLRG